MRSADAIQHGCIVLRRGQHHRLGTSGNQRVDGVYRALHVGLHAPVDASRDQRGSLAAEPIDRRI
jgi:hypothetical protein